MLESKNVRLRQIEASDLLKLRNWRNSPGIRSYTRGYRPLNMLNQTKWLESLSADQLNIMFAIEKKFDRELIGCCGLTNINWKEGHGEVSIYIGEKKWQSKGYASDALRLLLEYGFKELRLHRIYGIIFEYNDASIKFFEKNGFEFEGRHREARFWDGKFYDELVYGILDREYQRNSAIVAPISPKAQIAPQFDLNLRA
ncbi:MAG: GNAT family N-acetyltransferase [Deltaproteobacteria bacterium]|nr:GNAT family N-acetyltransferase [Deltaproteobacteria bacterium]